MPRTREQFQKMRDARKEKILLESAKAFAVEGYDSVTVDKIVEKAKCSHGLFYHYFKNKEDIFKCLISRLTSDKFEEYSEELNCLEPIDAIRNICTNILDQITKREDAPYLLYIYLTYNLQSDVPETLGNEKPTLGFTKLLSLIILGQEKGQVALGDPEEYMVCFISLLRGLIYTHINKIANKKPVTLPSVDVLMNLFIRKD